MTRETQTVHPPGHCIHMSLDHTKTTSESVARCDCGWFHRVPWIKGDGWTRKQDAAIEDHWREVRAKQERER